MPYGDAVQKLNPCDDSLVLTVLQAATQPPSPLLDIGCGRGDRLKAISAAYPDAVLCGVDCEEEMCRRAAESCPKAQVLPGNAQHLPVDSSVYRVVLCECTLSLLNEPQEGLSEIHRVLLPEGRLILSDLFFPESRPARIPLSSCGFLRSLSSFGWYDRAFAASGFSVISFRDCKNEFLAYAAQMIFDGSFCRAVTPSAADALKQYHASYGIWVLKKEVLF